MAYPPYSACRAFPYISKRHSIIIERLLSRLLTAPVAMAWGDVWQWFDGSGRIVHQGYRIVHARLTFNATRHSIRINDQWRICFEWADGDALNVEIVDYH